MRRFLPARNNILFSQKIKTSIDAVVLRSQSLSTSNKLDVIADKKQNIIEGEPYWTKQDKERLFNLKGVLVDEARHFPSITLTGTVALSTSTKFDVLCDKDKKQNIIKAEPQPQWTKEDKEHLFYLKGVLFDEASVYFPSIAIPHLHIPATILITIITMADPLGFVFNLGVNAFIYSSWQTTGMFTLDNRYSPQGRGITLGNSYVNRIALSKARSDPKLANVVRSIEILEEKERIYEAYVHNSYVNKKM